MLRSKSGQLFTQKTYHVKSVCTNAVVSMFLRKTRVAKTSTLFIAFKSPTSISAMDSENSGFSSYCSISQQIFLAGFGLVLCSFNKSELHKGLLDYINLLAFLID